LEELVIIFICFAAGDPVIKGVKTEKFFEVLYLYKNKNNMFMLLILFSALSLVSGIILTLKGGPYGKALSAIHKILSVIGVIMFCLIVIPMIKGKSMDVKIVLYLGLSGLSTILAIASGSILLNKTNFTMLLIHRISPFIAYASAAAVFLF